jgi:sterol 3beta-glucosyltransferase
MRITLFAFGTWGDVRPFVVLGMGLQAAGHDVQFE